MLNRFAIPLLLTLVLSACGFHLRGPVELPALLKQTRITGVAEFDPLRLELKRMLMNAGAQVYLPTDKTVVAIQISNENFSRRVLSVDAQGRAAEYGLVFSFDFQVKDTTGKILVPLQHIQINRDFRFDPNAVLAKESEEQHIRSDMVQRGVHQLIRRVDASMKQNPS